MGVWVEILSIISGDQLQERIWRPLQKKGDFFLLLLLFHPVPWYSASGYNQKVFVSCPSVPLFGYWLNSVTLQCQHTGHSV